MSKTQTFNSRNRKILGQYSCEKLCSSFVSYGWVGFSLFDEHFQFQLEWIFVDSLSWR